MIFCKSLAFLFLHTLANNLVVLDLVHHLPHTKLARLSFSMFMVKSIIFSKPKTIDLLK